MKNYKTKFLSPLPILIVTLFIVIGVWVGVIYQFQQRIEGVQNPALSTISSTTSVPVSDEATPGWKTYTDDTFGFSFKYPKEWYLEKLTDFDTVSNYKKSSKYSIASTPADLREIFIKKENSSADVTYASIKKEFSDVLIWDNYKSQYGVEGKLFTVYFSEKPVGRHSALIVLDGKGHKISISLGSSSEKAKGLFDQVISTLRFTK